MEFRPHKYQDYAREFIIGHPVCALILDMGLGKTVITLTALWELALDYFEVGKVLVIAPFRVARDTWKEELEKWDHLKGLSVSVVVGSEKERLDTRMHQVLREKGNKLSHVGIFTFEVSADGTISETGTAVSAILPYDKTGKYTGKGAFTIVEEAEGKGASLWGLLKSYQKKRNGWISLDYAERV